MTNREKVLIEDSEMRLACRIEMAPRLMPKAEARRVTRRERRLSMAQRGGYPFTEPRYSRDLVGV